MTKIVEHKRGFTLIELLVSSALFLTLMGISVGIFIQTLKTQRVVVALSESLNNASITIEQIAREVRVGFSFDGSTSDTLDFVNSDGDNVIYRRSVSGGVGRIERCLGASCSFITPPEVNISNMSFMYRGEQSGDGRPPQITILISVLNTNDIETNLQTTISSRIIDS